MNKDFYKLKIDEDFTSLMPPLLPEEQKELEESIIVNGCLEPLCVWNKTILDGCHRYEICTRLQIPFSITCIFIHSREEAVAWICANQLLRKNITEEARRYLIGKRYMTEKILNAHHAAGANHYHRKESRTRACFDSLNDENPTHTRERLGKEYHLSPATVAKYADYTLALDSISRIEPELISKILSGQAKVSQENLRRLSNLSPTEIQKISAEILHKETSYSETRNIVPKKKKVKQPAYPPVSTGSVKDMPTYDPSAGIMSLAFTIPSWVRTITRIQQLADLCEASRDARLRVEEELIALKDAVETMLQVVRQGEI